MPGYFSLVLHAHLPFVRHPEHERFLEESWLYEAITECYLPLLELLRDWQRERLNVRITLSLSSTLCAMLLDPLLQARYERRLNNLIELSDREVLRLHWERPRQALAEGYSGRWRALRRLWVASGRNLVGAFRQLQDEGRLELITSVATHALLPLLAGQPGALRAQVLLARDQYRACFGRDPVGFWLPECAYTPEVEEPLQQAGVRWFILDAHGLLNAIPRPRYGTLAPVVTPAGLAAFARDLDSARQVWSRREGYPGDARYRDFYRDIGFDLDLDYLEPYLPAPHRRGFTGLKYHAITAARGEKALYDPQTARLAVAEHAQHFLRAQLRQLTRQEPGMDRPPLAVAPFDAELFGHWWHEGPAFLDAFVRAAVAEPPAFGFITPTDYLRRHASNQAARPSPSSWGDQGYLGVWLNEKNQWIQPHLRAAGDRMTDLARLYARTDECAARVLRQAARELLLAQASDWPFMLHTETTPDYARQRLETHLQRFHRLHDQLLTTAVDPAGLAAMEEQDNLFPHLDHSYWLGSHLDI